MDRWGVTSPTWGPHLHVNRPLRPHESFTRCISFKLTYASHKLAPTFLKTQKLYSGLTELYTSIFTNKNERKEESKYNLLNAKIALTPNHNTPGLKKCQHKIDYFKKVESIHCHFANSWNFVT